MSSHWKAVFGIILIFIFGCFSGVVSSSIYFHRKMLDFLQHPALTILQAREDFLTKNLDLDATQKQQIHDAFLENLQQHKDAEKEIQPQIQMANRRTYAKITNLLRVDQRDRFLQNVVDFRKRALKAVAENSVPSPGQPVSPSTNSATATPPAAQ